MKLVNIQSLQIIFLIHLGLFVAINSYADSVPYSDTLKIKIESKKYVLIHFHDWTDNTHEKRFEMISTHQNPFLEANDYSYIELIDKETGKTIFKKPTPALTHLKISDDEKYIIGISNIMIENPYQLVIYDVSGNLIKKRHFSSVEAKLSPSEFIKFKKIFPDQFKYLDSTGNIYHVGKKVYIDFLQMGMPDRLGEAWSFLFKYITDNHLSENISESTTNWIHWFNYRNPEMSFINNDNNLISVSVNDPKGQKIKIFINEE